MNEHVRTLRSTAANVCANDGRSFHQLMKQQGLGEILDLADKGDWPAWRLARTVLLECCTENGVWNNCQTGFIAVLAFMKKTWGIGDVARDDLLKIMRTQPTADLLDRWFEGSVD